MSKTKLAERKISAAVVACLTQQGLDAQQIADTIGVTLGTFRRAVADDSEVYKAYHHGLNPLIDSAMTSLKRIASDPEAKGHFQAVQYILSNSTSFFSSAKGKVNDDKTIPNANVVRDYLKSA